MSNNPRAGERAENVRKILALRAEGLIYREIADQLGLSTSTVAEYITDPTGEKAQQRKERYRGRCAVCGKATTGTQGRREGPTYCADHFPGKREPRLWTRERILEAVRAWVVTYGEPPAQADWNGYHSQNILHDEERAARYRRLRAAGAIPSFSSVYKVFGSWAAMLEAAGYKARAPHATRENMKRRRKRQKTRCKRGHKFTPENTRLTRDGRACRACERIRYAARRQQHILLS